MRRFIALAALVVAGVFAVPAAANASSYGYTPSYHYTSPSIYSSSSIYSPSIYSPRSYSLPRFGYQRPGQYWVSGYVRRSGTYVAPYLRHYPTRSYGYGFGY